MIEETEQVKTKRIYGKEMDLSAINLAKGNQNIIQSPATCINLSMLVGQHIYKLIITFCQASQMQS